MGIEMEAGKPGWNDAMNGLPGLFGSEMPSVRARARARVRVGVRVRVRIQNPNPNPNPNP